MRVAVTGATGFIGTALVKALVSRGDSVVALSRRPGAISDAQIGVEAAAWPPSGSGFPDADAVVHLAGESVAGRWTPEKKRAIRESRAAGTRALVDAIGAAEARPRALIGASAVGYYGDRGEESLTETSAPGTDFLAEVCAEWERETGRATELRLRVATLRTGVVLGQGGGAMERMLPPFRMGVGGPMGSGRQWFPWIHLDDVVGLYLWMLDSDVSGPVNGAAPGIVRQGDFASALGKALHRPAILPTPKLPIRLMYGEFADRLFDSQRVIPEKAASQGYSFRFPELAPALGEIVR